MLLVIEHLGHFVLILFRYLCSLTAKGLNGLKTSRYLVPMSLSQRLLRSQISLLCAEQGDETGQPLLVLLLSSITGSTCRDELFL